MQRRLLIVGNWKMNGLVETALELVDDIRIGLAEREGGRLLSEVVICPPFTALYAVHHHLGDSSLKLGAQNMAVATHGAHTGEISGLMLRNVGCRYVILGHSERRQLWGENDALVGQKMVAAFRDGLIPILCVGETRQERDEGKTFSVVGQQVREILRHLPESHQPRWSQLVIAYEPVWAIGTGLNATSDQVQAVHAFIRQQVDAALGTELAGKIRLLYGGSMKADNAAAILSQPDVDGGLVGGAALQAQDFLAIIDACPQY